MCEDFALEPRTAGLAVTYFDRCVSSLGEQGLRKKRLQLLAMTCVLIAAKFSEVKMPGLEDLCEVAQNKFSKEELRAMELETLRVLQWKLYTVTPHAALQQLVILTDLASEADKPLLEHAEFFVDMSYYEVRAARHPFLSHALPLCHSPLSASAPSQYKTLPFPPLVIAASSLLCAWAHLGDVGSLTSHLPLLSTHCQASKQDLTRAQGILQDYFSQTFPDRAKAAERRCQEALAASRTLATLSPDTVMAANLTGAAATGTTSTDAVDAADAEVVELTSKVAKAMLLEETQAQARLAAAVAAKQAAKRPKERRPREDSQHGNRSAGLRSRGNRPLRPLALLARQAQ